MLNVLKAIFLPWLVIGELRDRLHRMTLHADFMFAGSMARGERVFELQREVHELRMRLAHPDANGKVARGPKGRFVSVKG